MATRRQYIQALQEADANGDQQAIAHFQSKIKNGEYDEDSNAAASFVQGFGSGASAGFSDEIGAGVRAGLGQFADKTLGSLLYASGWGHDFEEGDERSFFERAGDYASQTDDPRGFAERYDTGLASQREAQERARREDPGFSIAGEILGGVTGGGIGVGKAVAGQGIGRGIAKGIGAGAALGGLAGYGYSESDPLRAAAGGGNVMSESAGAIEDAMLGAGVGGVMGGAFPAAAAGARAATRFLAKPFTRKVRFNEEGRRMVLDSLREDIETGEITLKQALRELEETPGMTIADLGPATRELTETVAQTPTQGGRSLRTFLEDRNRDQFKRISPVLAKALGQKDDSFAAARTRVVKDMKEKASVAYKHAYADDVQITPEMRQILDNKALKPIFTNANELRLLRGQENKIPKKLPDVISTEDMDMIVRGFDDHVNELFSSPGRGNAAREAKALKQQLLDQVFEQNDAYKYARNTYANDKLNDEALEAGRRLFNDDADITAEVVERMSPAETTYFKIGALRAINKKLGNKSFTSDTTKGVFDRPNALDSLRVAFGGDEGLDTVMSLIQREQKMFETLKQAGTNSASARRLAQRESFAEKMAALGGYAAGSQFPGGSLFTMNVGGQAARGLFNKAFPRRGGPPPSAQRESVAIANQLQSNDLVKLMKPHTIGGLLDTGLPTSSGYVAGGGVSSGLLQPDVEYGK